jgi:hypothetical protein
MYTKNYPREAFHETAENAIRISQSKPGGDLLQIGTIACNARPYI